MKSKNYVLIKEDYKATNENKDQFFNNKSINLTEYDLKLIDRALYELSAYYDDLNCFENSYSKSLKDIAGSIEKLIGEK